MKKYLNNKHKIAIFYSLAVVVILSDSFIPKRSGCKSITANGSAIWGGCVTRRQHRAGSWYFSQKAVTVQGGYGVLFAVRIQSWLSITRVAVQV